MPKPKGMWWRTYYRFHERAGRSKALVVTAEPTLHLPMARHSSSKSPPAARCIAPQTPPPDSNEGFAELMIASELI